MQGVEIGCKVSIILLLTERRGVREKKRGGGGGREIERERDRQTDR